jgi:hypothetical protein
MIELFNNADLMGKLLPALVAGLFAFVPAILNWMSNQASARVRNGRVTLLAAELKLLEQWLNLSRSAQPSSRGGEAGEPSTAAPSLQPDLDNILAEYRSLRAQAALAQHRPDEVSPVARQLLLFRPLSFGGWMLTTVFWFLVIFVLGMVISEARAPEGELGVLILGSLVLFGPPLYLIRRKALRMRDAQVKVRQEALDPPGTNA